MIESVAIGCLLLAASCFWRGLLSVVRGRLSRAWPTTKGLIRKARVVKKHNSKGIEVWRHEIEYSYSVGRRAYLGTRVRFGIPNALSWSDPTSRSFRPFHKGARVKVHHSPLRPSVSALETGFSPFVFLTLAAGGVLAWMGFRLWTLPG